MKKIKNIDTVSHTYCGQEIVADGYYIIQPLEDILWANSDSLIIDITDGKIQINDGTIDISGISNQINFLKDIRLVPLDSDGTPLSRAKITATGWHYQLHGIEFETSKLNSLYSKRVDNTDYGFSTLKFYRDVSGVDTLITGDDLNQEYLDSNCIKTIIEWEPTHDIEIIGGLVKQYSAPTENIRLWVVGVPDVAAAYGGSKEFAVNINLKFIGIEDGVNVDGRAPKKMEYNSTYHTSKVQIILRHPVGLNHKLHMIFELFKP